jgi:hypothetical protein
MRGKFEKYYAIIILYDKPIFSAEVSGVCIAPGVLVPAINIK